MSSPIVRVFERIPAELWVVILGMVVACPELDADIESWSPIGTSIAESRTLLNAAKKTLRMRRAIAVSTRMWHGPALELLYKIVVLDSEHSARCLLRTLCNQRPFSIVTKRTRHLFVSPLALPYLAPILPCMPSITNFSIHDRTNGYGLRTMAACASAADALRILGESSGLSLRRLQLHRGLDAASIEDLLQYTPHLHTFIPGQRARKNANATGIRLPRLDKLTCLVLASVDDIITTMLTDSMQAPAHPALTQLALSTLPHNPLVHIHPFWRVQGPLLSALTLVVPHGVPTARSTLFSSIYALHLAAPALKRLRLVVDWDHDIIALLTVLPPRVALLAIHVAALPPADADMAETPCFNVLCSLEALKMTAATVGHGFATEVSVVRFTNAEHVRRMRELFETRGNCERRERKQRFWAARGLFKVEDHEGQPL
jgi:hypothetical protein